MTGCHSGRELLIQRQTIEAENLLSQMGQVTEYLQGLDRELISDYLCPNSAKFVQSLLTLLKRSSRDLSTLLAQIRILQSNRQPKAEKDTFTSSANKPRLYRCPDGNCPQCSNAFSSSHGMMNQGTESHLRKL